jgi:serine protease Do
MVYSPLCGGLSMLRPRCCALVLVGLFLAALPAQGQAISSLFKRVRDSVVVVKVTDEHRPAPSGLPDDYDGLGSGVLIDARGKVLTAAHVVEGAEHITVEFADGEVIPAKVAASSEGADVALVELAHPPKKPVVATLADSDGVEVGDHVFVVGAPLGISYTLTVGYVSGIREDDSTVHGLQTARYLQTDAAINPGNSGGPMFDDRGEVVGIVSYIISVSGGHEGLGFAVSVNTAKKLLIEDRTVLSGLEGILLDKDLSGYLNLPQPMGLLVQRVAPGSPSAAIGLLVGTVDAEIDGEEMRLGGDVILAIGGTALSKENLGALRERLRTLKPGQAVALSVLRAGKPVTLTATARD